VASRPKGRANESAGDDERLDVALPVPQRQEPESRQGLSTHAPMVARLSPSVIPTTRCRGSTVTAGQSCDCRPPRPALIDRAGARPRPESEGRIVEEYNPRWADWREFFTAELAENRWRGPRSVGRPTRAWHVGRPPGSSCHAARAMARRRRRSVAASWRRQLLGIVIRRAAGARARAVRSLR
jgi:hypothetical protein